MTWLPPGCASIRHVPAVPAPKKKCRWNAHTFGSFAGPSDSLFPSWIFAVPDARVAGVSPVDDAGAAVTADGADIGATLGAHATAKQATTKSSAARRARTVRDGGDLIVTSMTESEGRHHGTDGLLAKHRLPVANSRARPR